MSASLRPMRLPSCVMKGMRVLPVRPSAESIDTAFFVLIPSKPYLSTTVKFPSATFIESADFIASLFCFLFIASR